ncbi:MAG: NADH-quinone oxidoreductase subunit N [Bacteroidaceae bacterium]|nr:NADH-quinone oxidoreductase subunit N [Bacteroidaceae bacterium]
MDMSQYSLIWEYMQPELLLLVATILLFFIDLFASPRFLDKWFSGIACALLAIVTAVSCIPGSDTHTLFGGMFINTPMTTAMKMVLNIGTILVLLQAHSWINSEACRIRRGEFYELTFFTLFGMYLMMSSGHFLIFFIGLETASLPIAALVAFNKQGGDSYESGAKYLFNAVFSSAIFLMGISFMYGISGSLYFEDIAATATANTALFIVALAFIITGIGFKLSLVPFHLWTADVYQGGPTAVTAYLSVISKGAAAFAFIWVLYKTFSPSPEVWQGILYVLIILTITLGNLFAVRQKDLKRFLAFSSISQAGYIMLGVMAYSAQGLTALVYYILVYIFSNLAAFGVIASIENKTGKVNMEDYNGLYQTNPRLSLAMMLAMFSLAGIPPFAGFFSKFFIFASAVNSGFYILVLIALLNTIISLYYYLLVVKAMFINPNDNPIEPVKTNCYGRTGLVICVAGILILGIASCVYGYLSGLSLTVGI